MPRGGAEGAAQLAARHVEREVVAELHAADVLVEDDLHPLHQRLALLHVALARELGQQLLLLLVAPAAPPVAAEHDVVGGVGGEHEAGRGHVPQLGLLRAAVQRGPVEHLQIDVEADLLELLLGHLGVLVHELVFARGGPADGLARVARFLQQPLGLLGVVLVVELGARRGVPRLFGEEQAGVETVERLAAEAADHDRLHVQRGLERLPHLLVRHDAGLVVQHGHRPAARLDDPRLELGQGLDPVVGVLLHEHAVVVLAGLHAGQPHRGVGHRDEQDLVEVRDPLAAETAGRLAARDVVLEPDELQMTVGLVLDEPVRAGARVLLERAVAGRLDRLPWGRSAPCGSARPNSSEAEGCLSESTTV